MAGDTETITLGAAEDLLRRAIAAAGVAGAAAASVAAALVAAEAEGQAGHGFSRLGDYVAQARSGKVRADAEVTVTRTAPGALMIDAANGFAFPALDRAVEEGTAAAREVGVATMAVTRSHHAGALSVTVEKIAKAGCLGIMVANSPPAIAPWGAKTPIFGTNPIAFAAPRHGAEPLVIDLSLSRVARGKVMHAKKSGTPIPEGWALDAEGRPTTDPEAALAGSMIPIGEAKGTALALMVEVLASSMTGANPSAEAGSFFTADGPPPGTGQFLIAMRPNEGFAQRLEALLTSIAVLEGARLPGARRLEARARAEAAGIAVPTVYLALARDIAEGRA